MVAVDCYRFSGRESSNIDGCGRWCLLPGWRGATKSRVWFQKKTAADTSICSDGFRLDETPTRMKERVGWLLGRKGAAFGASAAKECAGGQPW